MSGYSLYVWGKNEINTLCLEMMKKTYFCRCRHKRNRSRLYPFLEDMAGFDASYG